MDNLNCEADLLLNKIVNSMGYRLVTWRTVDETIEKNISFIIILNINNYTNSEDLKKIKRKSFIV